MTNSQLGCKELFIKGGVPPLGAHELLEKYSSGNQQLLCNCSNTVPTPVLEASKHNQRVVPYMKKARLQTELRCRKTVSHCAVHLKSFLGLVKSVTGERIDTRPRMKDL